MHGGIDPNDIFQMFAGMGGGMGGQRRGGGGNMGGGGFPGGFTFRFGWTNRKTSKRELFQI